MKQRKRLASRPPKRMSKKPKRKRQVGLSWWRAPFGKTRCLPSANVHPFAPAFQNCSGGSELLGIDGNGFWLAVTWLQMFRVTGHFGARKLAKHDGRANVFINGTQAKRKPAQSCDCAGCYSTSVAADTEVPAIARSYFFFLPPVVGTVAIVWSMRPAIL